MKNLFKSLFISAALLLAVVTVTSTAEAVVVDTRPSNATYAQLPVPDQDLNNTAKPILYRYSISAPKKDVTVVAEEAITIARSGVSFEPVTLKIYSDSSFTKLLQEQKVKGKVVNASAETLTFKLSPRITVKAGNTVYVQVETSIAGNKDVAYITTGHKGMKDVTLKAKPILPPKLTSVQAKAALVNELFAGEKAVVYGQNIDANTKVFLLVKGVKKYFETSYTQAGSVNITTFANGALADGSYKLHAENGNKMSNALTIKYKNPVIEKDSITVVNPNGGELLKVGDTYVINWKSTGKNVLNNNVQIGLLDTRYSSEAGLRREANIAYSISNTGSYSWTIPESVGDMKLNDTDLSVYKIIVHSWSDATTGVAVAGVSNMPFAIQGKPAGLCVFTRDLTLGSTGDDVGMLQAFLQAKGFLATAGEDKYYFGPMTQAALAKYQVANGIIPATGYFGPIARAKIGIECEALVNAPTVKVTSIDVDDGGFESPIQGSYEFDFDVTAKNKDIYIYDEVARFDGSRGVMYEIINSSTGLRADGFIRQTNSLYADNDPSNNFYVVKAGTTEEFNASIILTGVEKTGMYAVKLASVQYALSPDLAAQRTEIQLGENARSNALFLYASASSTVPTGGGGVGGGGSATSTKTATSAKTSSSDTVISNEIQKIQILTPNDSPSFERGEKVPFSWKQQKSARKMSINILDEKNVVVHESNQFDGKGINKKSFSKKVTANLEPGSYVIEICDLTNGADAVCDLGGNFTLTGEGVVEIENMPTKDQSITLLSPNGGEEFKKGDKIPYNWKQGRNSKKLEVSLLSADSKIMHSTKFYEGGGNNTRVIKPGDMKHIPTGMYKLKICDIADSNKMICDASDAEFKLIAGSDTSGTSTAAITVLSPNGSETISLTRSEPWLTVKWKAPKVKGNVTISLEGERKSCIIGRTGAVVGAFTAMNPNFKCLEGSGVLTSGEYKVKVSSGNRDESGISDLSDNAFTLKVEGSKAVKTATDDIEEEVVDETETTPEIRFPQDACRNIPGNQPGIPEGYTNVGVKVSGDCKKIDDKQIKPVPDEKKAAKQSCQLRRTKMKDGEQIKAWKDVSCTSKDFLNGASKDKKVIEVKPVEEATESNSTSSYSGLADLELGMTHPDVRILQRFLNSNGYVINPVAGEPGSVGYEAAYFGAKTHEALIKYQIAKGINPAKGYFGAQTRSLMGI